LTGFLPEPVFLDLVEKGVEITTSSPPAGTNYAALAQNSILLLLPIFLIWNMLGGSRRFRIGGKFKVYYPGDIATTFKDVAGQPEAKADLQELVEFLKTPAKFTRLGAKIPKGWLMAGPPGVGKTLLARAVAAEAGVPMIVGSGSHFRETFMGQGANSVRNLFKLGKKHAPCLIFIDEIEVLGRRRSDSPTSGSIGNEEDATLNALLVELDGFAKSHGIVLVGATNRPDLLDPALTRPGRLDRHVSLGYPDTAGRLAILKVHSAAHPLAEDLDLHRIARKLTGTSGADLANLMNESAIRAARRGASVIEERDIDSSHMDILLGREKEGSPMREADRLTVAIHEAGHAVASALFEGASRPKQATIVPRGKSLGAVLSPPDEDRHLMSRVELVADIVVLLAGRAAEQLVLGFDKVTPGASEDFREATAIAYKMAAEWNMGGETPGLRLMPGMSQAAQAEAEAAAKVIIGDCWKLASDLLSRNEGSLKRIAEVLAEKEIVGGDEIMEICASSRPLAAAA
jgi:cell division protease FtsH